MRLLIVEDNPQVRRLMRRMLSDLAEDITECADGAEAVAAYTRSQPDWVLMDIEMKALDGITATRAIRAMDGAAKVIIVTSYDGAELREAARRAGACGYVLKENLLDLRGLLRAAR
ncbi:MAG: response regulator [Pyrinomonadaceae bacterium]